MAVMLAFTAGGLLVATQPRYMCPGPIRSTKSELRVIDSAVAIWMADFDGCPSMDDVGLSDEASRTDAWGHAYVIDCRPGGPVVRSAGPDGALGTEDDLAP